MQPISPCGRCDFHYDESLGTRCSSNKQNGLLAQSVYTHSAQSAQLAQSVGLYTDLCVTGKSVMGK